MVCQPPSLVTRKGKKKGLHLVAKREKEKVPPRRRKKRPILPHARGGDKKKVVSDIEKGEKKPNTCKEGLTSGECFSKRKGGVISHHRKQKALYSQRK